MASFGKRPHDSIDLTGEDEYVYPQRKQARSSQSLRSSQPQTSQSLNQSDAWPQPSQVENNDENDIIDLSQGGDEGFGWTCVGSIDGKIVGLRYYNGHATVGEQVLIKREPANPYDSNAVRIDNVQGTQIGHLPRNLASKLAPFLVCPLSSHRME